MLPDDSALTVAIALAAGAAVQAVARLARIPSIIVLLAVGAALGPEGFGWVLPASLGDGLFVLVDFAVAIILFEGALNLDLARLRREEAVIRRLITSGAVITLAGATLAARVWLGWPWALAALFGSLVVVTGPTVVGPLVRTLRLRPRLQTVLEAEGVFIDPIGALLAVLVLQLTLAADAPQAAAGIGDLAIRLPAGIAFGAVGGFAIGFLLRARRLVHALENVLVLGLVTLLFFLSEHTLSQTGLIAVTVGGVIVGNFENPVIDDLREFKDQLTLLLIGSLFVLLAADVGLSDVRGLGWPGVGVLLTLMLIVRPVCVWASTRASELTWQERTFVGAIAPRGIVAAAVASVIAATLDAQGIPGGGTMRALVFLVIGGTVIAAGALAWPLAALLGVRLPARDRVAILGAQGLGLALGTELRAHGGTVVVIDTDPQRCKEAERQGFTVVFGNGLQERTLRRARLELVGTAVGATFNDHLNSQFASFAREAFDVPRALVAIGAADAGRLPEHVVRHGADVLFEGPHDQERWDVRWRQGEVEILPFAYHAPAPVEERAGEPLGSAPAEGRTDLFVILTIQRGRTLLPMAHSVRLRDGDRAAVALFTRARDQALAELAAAGWQPAPGAEPQETGA